MNSHTWMAQNTRSLKGKTVAVTGATGGLGSAVCRYVLALSGRLILLTRDPGKTERLRRKLLQEFPRAEIEYLTAELTDMDQVRSMCRILKEKPVDFLLLNAGAYCLSREACATGFDPVFQINFAAQYYLAKQMLPVLAARSGKIIATGSIAHSACRTDPEDPDYARRKSPEMVYGNSKRRLQFSLMELVRENPGVKLAIAHPGITFTNITSHYPPSRLKLIKWPMKLTFMHPPKAARGIVRAMFEDIPYLHWIGPRYFDIWGDPAVSKLDSCGEAERKQIYQDAEKIYRKISGEYISESTAADDPAART